MAVVARDQRPMPPADTSDERSLVKPEPPKPQPFVEGDDLATVQEQILALRLDGRAPHPNPCALVGGPYVWPIKAGGHGAKVRSLAAAIKAALTVRGKLKRLQVYRVDACKFLTISERTFARLEADGILVPTLRGKGSKPSVYDLSVIVPAYITHVTNKPTTNGGSMFDARARRDRAQADFTELKTAERRKELLPRSQVVLEGQSLVKAAQAKLRALPRRLTQAGVPREHEQISSAIVREALEEMSRWSRYPKPLLRPLLEEVAQSVSTSSEVRALQAALSVAVAPASPPLPQTVDDARVAWRAARSSYRQARVAVRHGHRRRAELVAQIPLAIQRWRARWWHARRELRRHGWRPGSAAGVRRECPPRGPGAAGDSMNPRRRS